MYHYKKIILLILFVMILPLAPLSDPQENQVFSAEKKTANIESPAADLFKDDPVMILLGRSFNEIKQVLGEPDEQGYSTWSGPHYYMLFRHTGGAVRFYSPENTENNRVIAISFGAGREVLRAKTGMTFSEINDILGAPDLGPELGIDNLYYIYYFFGCTKNQVPEVYLAFSADTVNSPTYEAFVKWEAMNIWQAEECI